MLTPEEQYALYRLGILPKTYDDKGWASLFSSIIPSLKDKSRAARWLEGPFPDSRESIQKTATEYEKSFRESQEAKLSALALAAETGMMVLDADKFMKAPQEGQHDMIAKFIEKTLKIVFPCCYPELHPTIIDYLSHNFMYTPSGGKFLYYTRVSDSPNIWEEAPVAPPFENATGEFRSSLSGLLALTCSNEYLQVVARDKDGAVKLHRKVPKWKMFKKYKPEMMRYVTGSAEAVASVDKILDDFIADSKRRAEGRLVDAEIRQGVMEKIESLHELDLAIPDMPWCFRPEINITNMTNDLTTPAFAYFDLNSLTPGDTPDFDGFLTGIYPECRDTFMAAVYATFNANSRLSQYIWMHGEGGDGKSSFLSALAEYAGKRLACSLNAQALKGEFGLEECVGKRIVIISDVKTGLTVKNGTIHNLTGHDPVPVNRKGRPAITVTFNPVLWIAANDAPDVDFGNANESRRCIYIRVRKPDKEIQKRMYFLDDKGEILIGKNGKPQFNGYDLKSKLVAEMPHILYKCKEAFDRVCPAPHNAILQSDEALELAIANCIDLEADEMETYIQRTFLFDDANAKMQQADIFTAMQETRDADGRKTPYNNFEKARLRRKLETQHECQQVKIRGIYYLRGIRKRNGKDEFGIPDYISADTSFEGEI